MQTRQDFPVHGAKSNRDALLNYEHASKRRAPTARMAIVLAAGAISFLIGAGQASAANGSVAYTYDALGRVLTASYDTGVIVIYAYDPNGNRTQQTINVNAGPLCWTPVAGSCTSALWDNGLWF